MTKQEILIDAIIKAQTNGWEDGTLLMYQQPYLGNEVIGMLNDHTYKLLLTDHAFARALWGKAPLSGLCPIDGTEKCGDIDILENWQHHLQQMVVSEDWLGYISNYLEGLK